MHQSTERLNALSANPATKHLTNRLLQKQYCSLFCSITQNDLIHPEMLNGKKLPQWKLYGKNLGGLFLVEGKMCNKDMPL